MSNIIFHLPRVWLPRIKYSVRFSLRAQRDADVGSLMACVTYAGKRLRYALGFDRVPIPHWDPTRQRMYPRTPRATEINAEIDRHLEAVIFFFSSSRTAEAEQPTLEGLKATLFPARVHASKREDQQDSYYSTIHQSIS